MSISIAIAGKGGTGKTTLAALLIQELAKKGSVLAIDADPSANLHIALGLSLETTVGDIREEMTFLVQRGKLDPAMAKRDYLELKIYEALVEGSGVDLLAMGRPEGPGCYCAANEMLRQNIDRLASGYDFVVMDCEAGMEHISRQTTRDVDYLIILSDPTLRGIVAARRMKELIGELRTKTGRIVLVLNRIKDGLSEGLKRQILEHFGEVFILPEEPLLSELESNGQPVCQLPLDASLRLKVKELAQKLGLI